VPHIHQYNEKYIQAWLDYDSYAKTTDLYVSYEEAQLQFFNDMKIENYAEYFPHIEAMNNTLFTA